MPLSRVVDTYLHLPRARHQTPRNNSYTIESARNCSKYPTSSKPLEPCLLTHCIYHTRATSNIPILILPCLEKQLLWLPSQHSLLWSSGNQFLISSGAIGLRSTIKAFLSPHGINKSCLYISLGIVVKGRISPKWFFCYCSDVVTKCCVHIAALVQTLPIFQSKSKHLERKLRKEVCH